MISTWWASLSVIMKVLWGVTLSASLIFIIESILTFIGADADSSFDVDAPDVDVPGEFGGSTGMNLYTFRNLVNFVLGFGWTMILMHDKIQSRLVLVILALAIGIGLVAAVMYMFKWLSSMQQSGNIDVFKVAVGCQGKTYLTIPGDRQGTGKVQITINNSIREYDAMTDGDTIKTGTAIKVVDVIDGNTLVVEELASLII